MLSLILLGSTQIVWQQQLIGELTSAKSQALLFYLALHSRPQSRLHLAGLLWPGKSDQEALVNLRQTLYLLRQSLPGVIEANRRTVGLHKQIPLIVDVLEFETMINVGLAGDYESLQSAVDGYSGEFLSGFFVEDAPEFSEWILVERERLHSLMLRGLVQLSEHFVERRDIRRGIQYAGKLLAVEPWREESHRQMMKLLAWDGQIQAALAQYERCRQLLLDELDVEPSAETIALRGEIQSGTFSRFIPSLPAVARPSGTTRLVEWGDAPAFLSLHGREAELRKLQDTILEKKSRLVAVLGMGGQGKTALAAAFARSHTQAFEILLWMTLLNAPPLDDVLQSWLERLASETALNVPQSLDGKLDSLFGYMRQKRCLLILDNAESIMEGGQNAGAFREGYEPYEQLLRRFALGDHQSCLLLTSREKPKQFSQLERRHSLVSSLVLHGLEPAAGSAILQEEDLQGSEAEMQRLVRRYSGNPLALILIADTINDLYAGDIGAFLESQAGIFGNIEAVLAGQFNRLTALEKHVMLWLAVEREETSESLLDEQIRYPHTQADLLMALRSLERRSLIEKREAGFTLQNVLMDFSTDYLVAVVGKEMIRGTPELLAQLPLIKAQAKPYIRRAQERLLLGPVARGLSGRDGRLQAVTRLKEYLVSLPSAIRKYSYAGGNLLNLLLYLDVADELDFSETAVWQAHLRGKDLPPINFSGSDLIGSSFTDYGANVITLAFSPNGAYLAGSAHAGEIRLWDAVTRQPLRVFNSHSDFAGALCFSPDSRYLVSGGGDGFVCLWDVETGRRLHKFPAHENAIYDVAYAPGGDWIVGVSYNRLSFWDPISGQALFNQRFPGGYIHAMALSHDGRTLAVNNQSDILLYDVPTTLATGTCRLLRAFEGGPRPVRRLVFSHDDRSLASSGDRVSVWEVKTGRQLHVFATHTQTWGIVFHPGTNNLAAGSRDTIHMWDPQTGRLLRSFAAHEQIIGSLAYSPDGRVLASSSDDSRIRFWDLDGQNLYTIQGYLNMIHTLDLSPDGNYLACGSEDKKVRLWDHHTGELIKVWDDHQSLVWRVAFSPDGRSLATCSHDKVVRVWAIPSGEERYQLPSNGGRTYALTYNPDGCRLTTGDQDGNLTFWDAESGHRQQTFRHSAPICQVAFDPDGQHVAVVCFDQRIYIWNIESGRCVQTLPGHENEVWALAYSSDGRYLVSGSDDCTVRIWDADAGKCIYILDNHTGWVQALAFNHAGDLLVTGSQDKSIGLWDVTPLRRGKCPRLLHTLTGHTARVTAVRFTPDDAMIISSSLDETMRLWQADTGECMKTIRIPGPYAGMNISGATGLTTAQRRALRSLGAVENQQI